MLKPRYKPGDARPRSYRLTMLLVVSQSVNQLVDCLTLAYMSSKAYKICKANFANDGRVERKYDLFEI